VPRAISVEGSGRCQLATKRITVYGINADLQNNLYILDFGYGSGGIGRIDARTKQLTYFKSPTPDTRARRGKVDGQNTYGRIPGGGHWVGIMPVTDFEAQRMGRRTRVDSGTPDHSALETSPWIA
jgi:hypothetical protein